MGRQTEAEKAKLSQADEYTERQTSRQAGRRTQTHRQTDRGTQADGHRHTDTRTHRLTAFPVFAPEVETGFESGPELLFVGCSRHKLFPIDGGGGGGRVNVRLH